MGIGPLNISMPLTVGGDNILTSPTEIDTVLLQLQGGNFTQAYMAGSTTSVATIGSTAPAAPSIGWLWVDTSSTPHTLKRWDGTNWTSIWHVAATLPAWTSVGLPWYDTTLNLVRVYATIDSISGWHPVASGYQLMTNRGGAVVANDVVVRDTTGTTNREFKTTTLVKDQSVIGVALEAAATGANAVVALNVSGATVNMNVDTTLAIVKGDGLVTFSTAGKARTVGSLPSNAYTQAYARHYGIPIGCFAEALAAPVSGVVRVRLLGEVGGGAIVHHGQGGTTTPVVSGAAAASFTWASLTLTASNAALAPKHVPLAMANLLVEISSQQTSGGALNSVANYELSANRSSVEFNWRLDKYLNNGVVDDYDVREVWMPTVDDDTTPTGLGQKFAEQYTETSPASLSIVRLVRCVGYLY
jgi:hypothetical protein